MDSTVYQQEIYARFLYLRAWSWRRLNERRANSSMTAHEDGMRVEMELCKSILVNTGEGK